MSEFISNLLQRREGMFGLETLVSFECNFHMEEYSRPWFDLLGISFPPSLVGAVAKRQAEFLAGRYVSKKALSELGFQNVDLAIGKHRCPVWPESVVASITHFNEKALCVAAEKSHFRCIGVDCEGWVSGESYAALEEVVVNEPEKALLHSCNLNMEQAVVTVFSAKESLFKALYPFVGAYFDFSAAALTELCESSKSFELTLIDKLRREFTVGQKVTGKFEFDDSGVTTLIAF